MKLKTSLFNWTVFRKDVLRFFPVWTVYSVLQLISLNSAIAFQGSYLASSVADSLSSSAIDCAFYAALVCLFIFGDLYKTRLCNGIHAMPLQRHTLFFTHAIAALCFYVVPNAVEAVLMLLLLGRYWYVALYWLLGTTLVYVCILGICLFCIFCTGKRFAMVSVFFIILFFPLLLDGLLNTVYKPMLPGIVFSDGLFRRFSPLYAISSHDYFAIEESFNGYYDLNIISLRPIGSDWLYLVLWAAIGILFAAAALLLYRRRHLESAGDFLAVRFLRPIFLVCHTLVVAMVFRSMGGIIAMFLGLLIGYFTGLMLLNRSIRVFSGKAWIGLGVITGVMVLSLVLTAVDILGITRWVPKQEDVKQVRLSSSDYIDEIDISPFYINDETIMLQDEQGIADVIALHKFAKSDTRYRGDTVSLNIEYTMKNGSVRTRHYTIPIDSPQGRLFEQYMSRPEALFGEDPEGFLSKALITSLNGWSLPLEEQEAVKQMLLEDCRAGYMAQNYAFRDSKTFRIVLQYDDDSTTILVHDYRSSLYRWILKSDYSVSAP